jgi:prophage regulatory protein
MTDDLEHFLPISEVKRIAGNKSTRTIYRWVEQGLFPRPVALGPNSIGWPRSAIKEWVEARKAQVGMGECVTDDVCSRSPSLLLPSQ